MILAGVSYVYEKDSCIYAFAVRLGYFLLQIAVTPEMRNKGIGGKLFRAVRKSPMFILTPKGGTSNSFYAKEGCKKITSFYDTNVYKYSLRLPEIENTFTTSPTDPIKKHYEPIMGYFMNIRLSGTVKLMDNNYGRLLDAGCGGGVFLPELHSRCDDLWATDIHNHLDKVANLARKENIRVNVGYGDVTRLPFSDDYFDCIVCLSVLEFVKDVDAAARELHRVVRRGGIVIVGFPIQNVLTELAFLVSGITTRTHKSSHRDILKALKPLFKVTGHKSLPMMFAHYRLEK